MTALLKSNVAAYIAGGVGYALTASYFDAKNEIMCFREGNIDKFDLKYHKIRTECDAGWHGIGRGFPANLMTSVVWPIMLPLVTLPYLAVKMNPKPTTDQEL